MSDDPSWKLGPPDPTPEDLARERRINRELARFDPLRLRIAALLDEARLVAPEARWAADRLAVAVEHLASARDALLDSGDEFMLDMAEND